MHYRQRIRDAIAAALTAASTAAGANVFTSRARPILEILQRRESVLSVYTADEKSERNGDGYLLARTLIVSIEGALGGGDDVDDALDALAEQVEAAINADRTLGNLLDDEMVLVSTESEISAKGNMQIGAFRLDYQCRYLTDRGVDANLGPEPPIPTEIHINLVPTPQAYVEPLMDANLDGPPLFPAEGLDPALVPSSIPTDVIAPSRPPEPVRSPCKDGSCDMPEWMGDEQ